MVTRGRRCYKGELSPRAKLTVSQVKEIRKRYKWGNGKLLAAEFGVAHQTISEIITRRNWKHI